MKSEDNLVKQLTKSVFSAAILTAVRTATRALVQDGLKSWLKRKSDKTSKSEISLHPEIK